MKGISKARRLEEFSRRLNASPAAGNFEEAWRQITETLNQVEDELSGIANNPAAWETDGRLYPPQLDREYPFTRHRRVRRFRTVGHNILIGENGAIQIREWNPNPLDGELILSKAGGDGKEVMDQ